MRLPWRSSAAMVPLLASVVIAAEPATRSIAATARADESVFYTTVPETKGSIILGRPTDQSVTVSVLLRDSATVKVQYGRSAGSMDRQTDAVEIAAGVPREIVLDRLDAAARYQYRLVRVDTGEALLPVGCNGSFQTCRPAGEAFTFTVQADSHLDENCRPELYKACLGNVRAENPDFHIDLGDTFMSGKQATRDPAQYLAQHYYLGLVGDVAPVFLVVGNHDGEEVIKRGSAEADGLAVWSCRERKTFFPNPIPDGFYTGDSEKDPHVGLREDYYAWNWGDALFVVLDPYWTSRGTRGGIEPWNMTLGKVQYDWLAKTLHGSTAKYKFVFIHQLIGGIDTAGRGGVEAAGLYEWGGHEPDGRYTFAQHRPGWGEPVHDLFVRAGVTAVFHGHDHFYAYQKLDGIAYQLVPQPAQRPMRNFSPGEYGYRTGTILPGAGHLRVQVEASEVSVSYIRSNDSSTVCQYVIAPR